MNNNITDQILHLVKTQSRNKIVFYKDAINDISPVDVGSSLSKGLDNIQDFSKLPMRTSVELDRLLNSAIIDHPNFGKILPIANLGILFEAELKINFYSLLDNYSNNNILFVKWEGEIDDENLYFLTKENGIKINIKNLGYTAV